MVIVTTLPTGRPFTAADLETMPDDGHRYELIDGTLIVTPSPSRHHQLASSRLHLLLQATCPADLLVQYAPLDVKLAEDTVVEPDLLVVERSNFDDEDQPLRPLLAVEILSPSTRHLDLALKHARYAAAGIPAYWVVDPLSPLLVAWEWSDGDYLEVGRAAGHDTFFAIRPFPVEVTPARLLD